MHNDSIKEIQGGYPWTDTLSTKENSLTFNFLNDKISLKKESDDNNMSLVGLVKCNDGIVAIGDYKSTVTSMGGFKHQQENRDVIKVFMNKKFVFVTSGANEIITPDGKIYLEDKIKECFTDEISIVAFFAMLAHDLASVDSTFYFYVGYKNEENEYGLLKIIVGNGIFDKKILHTNNIFSGDQNYYDPMASLYIDTTKPSGQVAQKLEKALKSLIEFRSVEDRYQSVGLSKDGSVNVKIFK